MSYAAIVLFVWIVFPAVFFIISELIGVFYALIIVGTLTIFAFIALARRRQLKAAEPKRRNVVQRA